MSSNVFTLETVLRLYALYMQTEEHGLMPHAVGPPGVGKTWAVEKAAELLGVNLHVINVSRLSPLEVEGIQMPIKDNTELSFLTATFWTQIQEGDIVLFDEWLRGHPEVYNALLDIFTSRIVQGYKIPRSFWVGASNSIATYDSALEDRLMHIPVPDARKSSGVRKRIATTLVMATGMHPEMRDSLEMQDLIRREILPMYDMLDDLKAKKTAVRTEGTSLRNLIAQVNYRNYLSPALKDLIAANNLHASKELQYQLHSTVADAEPWRTLEKSDRLTPLQQRNVQIHLELAEMHEQLTSITEQEEENEDDLFKW